MELVIKEYLGERIQFKKINGEIYANATSMCKIFPNKNLSTWINSKGTEEYIEALCIENEQTKDFYTSVKSGSPENGGGTWVHQELVLDLARWLNTMFRIWCDKQIATLLREGTVTLKELPKTEEETLMKLFPETDCNLIALTAQTIRTNALLKNEVAENQITIKEKNEAIAFATQQYDGLVLRAAANKYVRRIVERTGKGFDEVWGEIYNLVGLELGIDLKSKKEKFKKAERAKVIENKEFNKINKLKGLAKSRPCLLSETDYEISTLNFICKILGAGGTLLSIMAKMFETDVAELIDDYQFQYEILK